MRNNVLAMMIACLLATGMAAQTNESTKIKVTNIPDATGKVLLRTDKGQHGMADAKGEETIIEIKKLPIGKYKLDVIHDANGNWKLDMDRNNVPTENCASVEVEIKEDTHLIIVELKDLKKKTTH